MFNGGNQDMENVHTIMLDDFSSNVTVGVSSVIGRRKEQQDAVRSDDDYALMEYEKFIAVLCDGMGGLSGGQQASNLCATLVKDAFHGEDKTIEIDKFYKKIITESDTQVKGLKDESGKKIKAGTTMVSVAIIDEKLHWASVGDSRIYIIRGNTITCVTHDHNYLMTLNEMVKRGEITREEADKHPKKEALISYIGMGGVKYIDMNAKPFQLQDDDYIILCSDGLYRTVSEEDMKGIVCGIGNAEDAATCLTHYAMGAKKRGQDNASVIVINYKKN